VTSLTIQIIPSLEEYRLLGSYAVWLLLRTDVLEESIASIIKVTRIGELRTTLAVTSNRRMLQRNNPNVVPSSPILVTLMMEVIYSSETSVLMRATRRNIPEEGIFHSHRRENLESYIALTSWDL
jgi:hypothetical protein